MTRLPVEFIKLPVAHRALHDIAAARAENSRAAVRAAIAAGYAIEIDLQLSRDGRAMVFHDYHLERLTNATGAIQQRTAAELADVMLTVGHEPVPTLAEVLELVAGRVPMLIELKDQHGQMGPTDGRLERAVAQDLQGYTGPVAVMSFNPNTVARLAELLPEVARGIISSDFRPEYWHLLHPDIRERLRDIPDFSRVGADFLSHEVSDLHRERVGEIKETGATILCWTVRSQDQEEGARQLADNITFEGYQAKIPA